MLSLNFDKFPVLETARLILRAPEPSDAAAVLDLRGNDKVMAYIPRPKAKNIDDALTHINNVLTGFSSQKSINFAITLKTEPGKVIGFIGYNNIDLANHRAEIGYLLHPDHWQQGLVGEALKEVLDFGFSVMRLHTVSAIIDPENDASRQVLLKNGFVKEAYFKEDFYFEGKFLDSEIYGKVTHIC